MQASQTSFLDYSTATPLHEELLEDIHEKLQTQHIRASLEAHSPEEQSITLRATFEENHHAELYQLLQQLHQLPLWKNFRLENIRHAKSKNSKKRNILDEHHSCYQLSIPDAQKSAIKSWIEEAYMSWLGGIEYVRDPDSIPFDNFDERLHYLLQEKISCSQRTGQEKKYIPNISHYSFQETLRRYQLCKEQGMSILSISLELLGLSAAWDLLKASEEDGITLLGIINNPCQQWTHKSTAQFWASMGFPLLHLAKQNSTWHEDLIQDFHQQELNSHFLLSDDLHPGSLEAILQELSAPVLVECSSAVREHPYGIKAGADAFQFSLQASKKGLHIPEVVEKNENFQRALREWAPELLEDPWTMKTA